MSATHLTVIGGGPGGYAAAFLAASHGLKVTLIDRMATPGGVCLHRGCIPSKALLHVAALLGETREAEKMGLLFAEPRVNLDRMRDWKQGVVDKLTGGLATQCQRRGVEFIQAEARFVASARLELTAPDGSVSQRDCEHVILASGSRPASIPALSLESPKVWDSTAALAL
ncbi:MAG: FAD-dependent oxidoreductase, partial [Calditrichaeota bacterium]|nr:FAD-dependent oxidoreductase [Calditrichota bacterium]